MNAPAPNSGQQQQNNDLPVPVEANLFVSIGNVLRGLAPYTSHQNLQQAMSEDTTLTNLIICLREYDPIERNDHGFIQFLLQYIISRNHLRKLNLGCSQQHAFVFQQFVMAAAGSKSIHHLCFIGVRLDIFQPLVQFCRANRTVKILEIDHAHFWSDETASLDFPSHPVEQSCTTALDKLILKNINFVSRQQARIFADILAPRLKPAALELGRLIFDSPDRRAELSPRIVSALMQSPVTCLTLRRECSIEAFCAALTAGMAAVKSLSVDLYPAFPGKKFVALANTLPDNVKALSLTFTHYERWRTRGHLPAEAKRLLFRALDACATLTAIQVDVPGNDATGTFTQQEMVLLQDGRTERNYELCRFEANPLGYPDRDLLRLMLQMGNSLTGLFKVVRNIPDRIQPNSA